MKRARSFLPLLLGLIAVLCGLTAWSLYRERKQERLNRDLIAAVKNNDTRAVITLLNQGADANCHDESYKPVPWWQLLRDRMRGVKPKPSTAPTPLLLALENRIGRDVFPPENLPLATVLLNHGADVNARNENENTPLLCAIVGQKKATVHLLLKYGADMNNSRRRPVPLLMESVILLPDCTDVLSDMLHRGVDVNQRDRSGITALSMAVFEDNVKAVRLLLSYHADVTLVSLGEGTPLAMAKRELVQADRNEDKEDSAKARQIIRLLKQAGAKK